MKKSLSILLGFTLILTLLLTGCKKDSIDDFEGAINKNKDIKYSKQETTLKADIMGMEFNLLAKGEVDKKNNTSMFKVNYNTNVDKSLNAEMDIYADASSIYVKDKASEEYLKSNSEAKDMAETASASIGKLLLETFKGDKEFKKSFTITDGDNRVVSASISDESAKSIFDKAIEEGDMFTMIEEAMASQLVAMAQQSGSVTASKDKVVEAAKQEAKLATEEMKKQFKALKFTNVKYKGTINKEGYLSAEEFSLSVIEPSTSVAVLVNIKMSQTDINKDKVVKLPNIPKDKIVDITK
ncbi:MAG: hypothetical protein RR840_01690 [Clostridium sp.]